MRTWRNLAFDLLYQACWNEQEERICHEGLGVWEEAVNMFLEIGWLRDVDDSCGFSCVIEDWGMVQKG